MATYGYLWPVVWQAPGPVDVLRSWIHKKVDHSKQKGGSEHDYIAMLLCSMAKVSHESLGIFGISNI